MTVAELIAELEKYPGSMEVLRDDDEGGPGHISRVEACTYPNWSDRIAVVMATLNVHAEDVVVIR